MADSLTLEEVLLLAGKTNGLVMTMPEEPAAFVAFIEDPLKGGRLLRQLLALEAVVNDESQEHAARKVAEGALQKHTGFDFHLAAQQQRIRPPGPGEITSLLDGLKTSTPGWEAAVAAQIHKMGKFEASAAQPGGIGDAALQGKLGASTPLILGRGGLTKKP